MTHIEYVDNIFGLFPEAIVHPVNRVGLSHTPFSNTIKKSWPDYFKHYTRSCIRKHLVLGSATSYQLNVLFDTRLIFMMVIKDTWRESLRPDILRTALANLSQEICKSGVQTVALPSFQNNVPDGWIEKELQKIKKEGKFFQVNKIYLANL